MALPRTEGRKGPRLSSQRFVRAMQLNLLQRALAPWPRRQAPLLDVNCGDGFFLPSLWRSGFDLVATEADADLRARARGRSVPDLEIFAAAPEDLPFADDDFDWVILHLRDGSRVPAAAQEALRVSKRGVMLTFWNSASLAGILGRRGLARAAANDTPLAWGRVWSTLRGLRAGRLQALSTLWLLPATWSGRCHLAFVNGWFPMLPLGAWCVMRLDLGRAHPVTPLPLRWRKILRRPQPALEYTHKNK